MIVWVTVRALLAATVLVSMTAAATSPACETETCVFRRGVARYQRCYKQALERDSPTLAGKALLTITVRPSGQVEKVTVDFPAASPQLLICLREATLKFWFRAETYGRVLSMPLVFDPGARR